MLGKKISPTTLHAIPPIPLLHYNDYFIPLNFSNQFLTLRILLYTTMALRDVIEHASIQSSRTQTPSRLSSNFAAADESDERLILSEKQMTELTNLSRPSGRRIALRELANCKDYPFKDENPPRTIKCVNDPSVLAGSFHPG